MATGAAKPATVDAYIATFPPKVRAILKQVRATIRKAAPDADEVISYRIPCFRQDGTVVAYFAAFTAHVGFFPPVKGDAKLVQAAARFAGPKGNLRFPLDEPMPLALIGRIVKQRVKDLRTADARKR